PSGFRIERLEPPGPGAESLLSGGRFITPEGDCGYLRAASHGCSTARDECLGYTVGLPAALPDGFARIGEDLMASPDGWLWVPTPQPDGVRIEVQFVLPAGMRALV